MAPWFTPELIIGFTQNVIPRFRTRLDRRVDPRVNTRVSPEGDPSVDNQRSLAMETTIHVDMDSNILETISPSSFCAP